MKAKKFDLNRGLLQSFRPCPPGWEFAQTCRTANSGWQKCPNPNWMLWLTRQIYHNCSGHPTLFSENQCRQLIRHAAEFFITKARAQLSARNFKQLQPIFCRFEKALKQKEFWEQRCWNSLEYDLYTIASPWLSNRNGRAAVKALVVIARLMAGHSFACRIGRASTGTAANTRCSILQQILQQIELWNTGQTPLDRTKCVLKMILKVNPRPFKH